QRACCRWPCSGASRVGVACAAPRGYRPTSSKLQECNHHRLSLPSGSVPHQTIRRGSTRIKTRVNGGGYRMHCPFCGFEDSRVLDSRPSDAGTAIRRRRRCPACARRFTTVETAALIVKKRSGATQAFSREKVIAGVRKACQGRPVTEDALALLGQRVEEAVRATGRGVLPAHE